MTKAPPGPTETVISGQIRDYINLHGIGFVWRNNTIKGRTQEGRFFQNGIKGSPDLVGFTNKGYFLGVEVKRPGKQLTFYQKLFAKKVRETDKGVYIVARSIDDIMRQLEGFYNPLPF